MSDPSENKPDSDDAPLDVVLVEAADSPALPPPFAPSPFAPSAGSPTAAWRSAPTESTPPSPPPAAPPPATDDEDDGDGEPVKLKSRLEDSEMDMTPMVDIVFQLLIFFMVTASFSLQKSLEIPKPKEDRPSTSAAPQEDDIEGDFITVYVDEFNTYRIETTDWEEEAPSEQDLLIKLRRARLGDAGGKVPNRLIVKAHGDSMHEKVVAALDAGTSVGMEQIQLQTVESDE